MKAEGAAGSPVHGGVSCAKPSPGPWEPVYTLPLQPPADSGLTTCNHQDQAFRSAHVPFPHPSLSSMRRSLSSADLVMALCIRVCAASRSMRSARDLQGTLLQSIPLLSVFPPAFYRTVGFHGDFSPHLMNLNK